MDSVGVFKRCVRCEAVVPADATFCGKCGCVIGTSCPRCQKPVDPQTEYCCYCGQTLSERAASLAPPPPLPYSASKRPDWTKGERDDHSAPVIIINSERTTSRGAIWTASTLCAAALAFFAWQWGANEISGMVRSVAPAPGTSPRFHPTPAVSDGTARPFPVTQPGPQPTGQPTAQPALLPGSQPTMIRYWQMPDPASVTVRPVPNRKPADNVAPGFPLQPGAGERHVPSVTTSQAGPEIPEAPVRLPIQGQPSGTVIGRPGLQYMVPMKTAPTREKGTAPGTIRKGQGAYISGTMENGHWKTTDHYGPGNRY